MESFSYSEQKINGVWSCSISAHGRGAWYFLVQFSRFSKEHTPLGTSLYHFCPPPSQKSHEVHTFSFSSLLPQFSQQYQKWLMMWSVQAPILLFPLSFAT